MLKSNTFSIPSNIISQKAKDFFYIQYHRYNMIEYYRYFYPTFYHKRLRDDDNQHIKFKAAFLIFIRYIIIITYKATITLICFFVLRVPTVPKL